MKKDDNNKLPTLADLHHDNEVAIKNDALKLLLNNEPPQSWVKPHPFAKHKGQPVPYIPIGRIESLLDKIFQDWRVEILNIAQLFNSVCVTVRVHYMNPIDGTWRYHDGVGAVGVQTDKGQSASNLGAIKQDAIMKAAPAAKSYAIKDACDHLGKLFGRNISRPDSYDFTPSYTKQEDTLEKVRIIEWLKSGNVTFNQLVEFKEGDIWPKYESDKEITELVIKLESEL